MKVIFAGFPKTGTKTVNAALKELGYNVYDLVENFQYLQHEWERILYKGGSTEDFRRMFQDVDAVTDIPGCFFWEELHKAFPEAKLIFRQRESEEIWWRSFEKQIKSHEALIIKLLTLLSPSFNILNRWAFNVLQVTCGMKVDKPFFGRMQFSELMARKFYRLHNSYFLQNAPLDKVLMIDFEQGWEPLCNFLRVPIPNTPFPHKNKNASMITESLQSPFFARFKYEMLASSCCFVCLVGYGIHQLATRPSAAPSLQGYLTSAGGYIWTQLGFANS